MTTEDPCEEVCHPGQGCCGGTARPSMTDFIWTGNWPDAVQFMDRVGYSVPFLGEPAIRICNDGDGTPVLHVINEFLGNHEHAAIGDRIRWYPSTRTFGVVR